jgi:hypothetical protein
MTSYCAIAKHILSSNPPPYRTFLCHVVELDEYPGVVFLRMYAQNLAEHSDNQIAGITEWLNKVLRLLNEHPLVVAPYTHLITEENPR